MAELCGRKDRQVKIRGLRVDPGEVEAALRRCPGIADAAVIVRSEHSMDVALVGFVVAQPWATRLDNKDLRDAVSAWLPAQKCPAMIRLIEEIPRLPSFKPDLTTLAALDLAQRSTKDAAEAPLFGHTICPVEDAGGDSLKALQLLLHIEDTLGQRLSTDVLSVGMTPSSLSAAIERGIADLPEGAAAHEAEDGRITVFLMPGILYDELGLAQFRHTLRDRIRFVLIGYPNWRETIAAKADFDAIVTAALAQILSQCGDRPIYLAGYSFGGFVAYAAAHRLVESGRRVAFLGLLDTRRQSRFASLPLASAVRSMKVIDRIKCHVKDADIIDVLFRIILRIFLEVRAFVVLEAFARLCMTLNGRRAEPHLLFVLRSYALQRWLPNTLPLPTFFFRSEDNPQHQAYDCGWSTSCPLLTVVPIEGDHSSMLAPAHTERLCATFLEALHAADHAGNRSRA